MIIIIVVLKRGKLSKSEGIKSGCQRKPGSVKNVNGRGSTE